MTFDKVRQRMAVDEAVESSVVVDEGVAVATDNPYPEEADDVG